MGLYRDIGPILVLVGYGKALCLMGGDGLTFAGKQ